MDPRRRHVVAVARPGDRLALDGALVLLVGHDIGHQLAGVGFVGEPVDHRHGRAFRHLEDFASTVVRIMMIST